MFHVHRGMNDFRQIMYDGHRFTPDDFNLEHEKCLQFLRPLSLIKRASFSGECSKKVGKCMDLSIVKNTTT